VLAPPVGFDEGALRDVLRSSWSISSPLTYAAVGFGSHHWLTDDWFVTVDIAADHDLLRAALVTATALRHDAGLSFVHAPVPAADGRLVVPLGSSWVVHVYERLSIVDDTAFRRSHTDPEVLALVREVHAATPIVEAHAWREDWVLWDREDLEEALDDLDSVWWTGPYAERARALLASRAEDLRHLLSVYDTLCAAVPPDGWVVTHGEPHPGNVFRTTTGWAMVDWDTVLIAPAERDLWSLDVPGVERDPDLARLYRLRWDLDEIAVYTAELYGDHIEDANAAKSWEGFVGYLDLRTRWPDLFG